MQKVAVLVAAVQLFGAGSASSESMFDILTSGQYDVIWKGYAQISTCAGSDDSHVLGPYVFVCDGSYEYPYHYGNAALVGTSFTANGNTHTMVYLCLDGEEECLRGSLYRR